MPALVKEKPELANVEPFKTVLSGDREAIAKLPKEDLIKVLAATLTGMSVDQFQSEARSWLEARRTRVGSALYRDGLPADDRASQVPARERL